MIVPINSTIIATAESSKNLQTLKTTTKEMEAQFVKQLVEQLQKTTSEEFKDVPGGDVYQGMMSDALAHRLVDSADFGIAKIMFHQLAGQAVSEQATRDSLKNNKS